MSEYYQFAGDIDKESSREKSPMRRHKDYIWDRRPDFLNLKLLKEGQLKVLYFLSYAALVCVSHFSKLFYLKAGLSVGQISVLQCIFYLSRYSGFSTILSMEGWFNGTRDEDGCLTYLRTILVISVCISTVFWLLLLFPGIQKFGTLIGLVFIASITISTSHGFLDIVAEDTIRNTKTKINYAGLRFWGLFSWGVCSVGIGTIVDVAGLNMIFYLFAAFQILFLFFLCCWFPSKHVRNRNETSHSNLWQNMCRGGGMFNVYFFILLFGMVNALPEILMLHLKLTFDIKAIFLGALISAMAFGEMFGYFLISVFDCGLSIFYLLGTLTLVFTGVRLAYWGSITSEYIFLASEFVEYSFLAIFWVSTLQMVKSLSVFLPNMQNDFQNIWHYQSLGFGILIYGTLYDFLGAETCFKVSAGVTAVLILYFFLTFSCAEKRKSFDERDSLLLPSEDEEEPGTKASNDVFGEVDQDSRLEVQREEIIAENFQDGGRERNSGAVLSASSPQQNN